MRTSGRPEPPEPASSEPTAPPLRAVMYARMSTEHQQYSIDNQSDVIRAYAAQHGMEVVHTYNDGGKSGLRADNRDSLQRLMQDAMSSARDFEATSGDLPVVHHVRLTFTGPADSDSPGITPLQGAPHGLCSAPRAAPPSLALWL